MAADTEYDYIICGGGTAGCVIACRLAEDPNVKVLVLEAGHHNEKLDNVHMPGGWGKVIESEHDWRQLSEPMPSINNKVIKCSHARFLGGSSGMNGTLCVRGTKQDYDDWGLENWSGEKMWEYMKKTETFHPHEWHKEDKAEHGYSGELHVEPHKLAPISELLKESLADKGMPYHPDMFSSGNVVQGCGDVPRTVYKGVRTTSADFVTRSNARNNITIKTEIYVDKVLFSESEPLTAKSVAAITKDGKEVTFAAKKEIIVSAGAYCSPLILLRSGIGASSELAEHDIKTVVDLPGVGKNLQDHPLIFAFYEVNKPNLTNDAHVYHEGGAAASYERYMATKDGVLASWPFGIFAYSRLDERLKDNPIWKSAPRKEGRDPMGLTSSQPHIEIFNTEMYGGPPQYADFPVDKHAFSVCSLLLNQRSRGTVKLASRDPKANAIVDHKYLEDPLDLAVLTEAVKLSNEVVTQGKGTKDVIKGSWPSTHSHHGYTTNEQWEGFVKEHVVTCYHASSTCAMGKDNDKLAVLDDRLRVRGVKGLRVADVSSVPTGNSGHTQMVAFGVGEGAATLIKEDAK